MKTKFTILIITLLVLACTPVRVVDYQKKVTADLKSYKTFSYFQVEKSGLIGANFEYNLVHLKKSITAEMTSRGFQEAETDGDLLVNIGIVVKEEIQTRETDLRTDGMQYIGQRNYKWESQEIEVSRYKEGTVKIDMVDRSHNTGVWTGTMAGTATDNKTKAEERIQKATAMLFKKFPVEK